MKSSTSAQAVRVHHGRRQTHSVAPSKSGLRSRKKRRLSKDPDSRYARQRASKLNSGGVPIWTFRKPGTLDVPRSETMPAFEEQVVPQLDLGTAQWAFPQVQRSSPLSGGPMPRGGRCWPGSSADYTQIRGSSARRNNQAKMALAMHSSSASSTVSTSHGRRVPYSAARSLKVSDGASRFAIRGLGRRGNKWARGGGGRRTR